MITLTLIEPQIPQNTGNIGRLCAATNTALHIVGKPGFYFSDKYLKRSGMDYWSMVQYQLFEDIEEYFLQLRSCEFFLFSSKAEKNYTDISYSENTTLIFGNENRGLPPKILKKYFNVACKIPMTNPRARCLNLANSVGIGLYEVIRQQTYLRF